MVEIAKTWFGRPGMQGRQLSTRDMACILDGKNGNFWQGGRGTHEETIKHRKKGATPQGGPLIWRHYCLVSGLTAFPNELASF